MTPGAGQKGHSLLQVYVVQPTQLNLRSKVTLACMEGGYGVLWPARADSKASQSSFRARFSLT